MEFLKTELVKLRDRFTVWFNTPTYTTNGNATIILLINVVALYFVVCTL